MPKNIALFLDRDGVINHDYGYVHSQVNFRFINGIFDLARHAHNNLFKIVVVTNQSGIGRGLYTENQYHDLSQWMRNKFAKEGAPIECVYFSPYHPVHGLGRYLRDDFSRKPKPGMILQAQKDLHLNLEESVLIGDKKSDIQAGLAAGVGVNLLFLNKKRSGTKSSEYKVIANLREAIPYLTR